MMKSEKIWNVILWITQLGVALFFFLVGYMKLVHGGELPWPWTKEYPSLLVLTGILDLLLGVGLLLPGILRIQPKVGVIAAFGGVVLMITAIIFHVSRGEASVIGLNFIVLALALFIAWGRTAKAPIYPGNRW